MVAIDAGLPELSVERLTLATTSIPSAVRKVTAAVDDREDLALGGRSFGGRACSVAVAEGLPAVALVLLSYPLHPPGKPDKLRVDHFEKIEVPTLFVSGEKDPFATPDELRAHTEAIPGEVSIEFVPGNHSPKGQDDRIIEIIRDFLCI